LSHAEEVFTQRLLAWETRHRLEGAGRSYPYAWRLPELARPLGRACLHRAENALALDLYTLGRFPEALAALSAMNSSPQAQILRHRARTLMDASAAVPKAEDDPMESRYLAYLEDQAQPTAALAGCSEPDGLWCGLLEVWGRARQGQALCLTPSHRALAGLRRLNPALAAQAEAVFAETVFHLGPRWAAVWLDHALDQVDRFSQHHLKARLLGLKAKALEAAGELGEGARFRKQARALAERQGARLYLRRFIDPT